MWSKVQKGLSAGRVQSVAVRFITEREEEIRTFKQEEYWKLKGLVENINKKRFNVLLEKYKNKKVDIKSIEQLKKILEPALGTIEYEQVKSEKSQKDFLNLQCNLNNEKKLKVTDVTKKNIKKSPAPPFTTSTLQQEAHRKFGFAVASTMSIAQQLYEGIDLDSGRVGLITYMRTDSVNLAEESLDQIKKYINESIGSEYALNSHRKYKTQSKGAQEAHEAIRPVDVTLIPEKLCNHLNPQQLKLYTLIWKRTVATQMQDAQLENTDIKLELEDNKDLQFNAVGQVIKFDGFMA